MSTPSYKAAQTRAINYNGPQRRPVSASLTRRITWNPNEKEETKFEAYLVATQQAARPRSLRPTSAATTQRSRLSRPGTAGSFASSTGSKAVKYRDLLSSHRHRVARAADSGRATPVESIIAREVVDWQLEQRRQQSNEELLQVEQNAASRFRPQSAGFSVYRPETADEWVMNHLWEKRREEEVIQNRNALQVQQALNEWQTHKHRMEEEIQRRIESKRRPYTSQGTFGRSARMYDTTVSKLKDMFVPKETSKTSHTTEYDISDTLSIDSDTPHQNDANDTRPSRAVSASNRRRLTVPIVISKSSNKDNTRTTQVSDHISQSTVTGQSNLHRPATAAASLMRGRGRPLGALPLIESSTDSLEPMQSTRPSTSIGLRARNAWYTTEQEIPTPDIEQARHTSLQQEFCDTSAMEYAANCIETKQTERAVENAQLHGIISQQTLRRALSLETHDPVAAKKAEIEFLRKQEEEEKAARATRRRSKSKTNKSRPSTAGSRSRTRPSTAGSRSRPTSRASQNSRMTARPATANVAPSKPPIVIPGLAASGAFLRENPLLQMKLDIANAKKKMAKGGKKKGRRGKKK